MKFRFSPTPDLGGPKLRLPLVPLLMGWMLGSLAVLGGGAALGSALGASGSQLSAGLLGASIAVGVMGFGLLVAGPGKERSATDMPIAWLASTVIRFLAAPGIGFVLYFALRPDLKPYVLGLALAYLVLLVIEVLIAVSDLRRQLDRIESEASVQETDGLPHEGSST